MFGPIPTRRFLPQNDRIEHTGLRTRNVIKSVTGTRWNFSGVKGVFGTIGIGALIDAGVQLGSDMLADPCSYSLADRFSRAGVAFGFGLVSAAIGTGVFGAALAVGAPGMVAAGIGVGISYGVGVALNTWKQEILDGI